MADQLPEIETALYYKLFIFYNMFLLLVMETTELVIILLQTCLLLNTLFVTVTHVFSLLDLHEQPHYYILPIARIIGNKRVYV